MSQPAILHLIHNLKREGAQQMVANLAQAAVRQGIRHLVVGWRASGPLAADLAAAGVPVTAPLTRHGGPAGLLAAALRVHRLVQQEKVGVLHAHMSDAALLAALVSRLSGQPFLITHHSTRIMPSGHGIGGSLRRHSFDWAARAAVANVAVADQVAAELRAAFPHLEPARLPIVANGVLIPDPADLAAAMAARRSRYDGPEWPHLVCVGRLVAVKNQDLLLQAAPLLLPRYPGLRITLAGGGPRQAELVAMAERMGIATRVHLAGSVGNVPGLLRTADLYVSTSHYEGLPMSVLEAMAWGVPVIASDVPGNRDAIRPKGCGWLGWGFPLAGPDALAAAISAALDNRATSEQLAQAAALRVARYNGTDAMHSAYQALYALPHAAQTPRSPLLYKRKVG